MIIRYLDPWGSFLRGSLNDATRKDTPRRLRCLGLGVSGLVLGFWVEGCWGSVLRAPFLSTPISHKNKKVKLSDSY